MDGSPRGKGALKDLQQSFPHAWIYVAELLQNAVDAGARTIRFSEPTPGAFFSSSDDQIIAKWNLAGGFDMAGVLQASTGSQALSGNWNPGDALKLYWYPSLTVDATTPGSDGVHFGAYSGTAGVNGSEAK